MNAARALVVAGALALFALPAEATRFRRPFWPDARVTANFDDDRRWGRELDYVCRGWTYDNHTGTDFGVYFTDILAVADGVVESAWQGCADYGYRGNQCGNQCGNGIRLRVADGTVAVYCHLKNGSIAVRAGDRVGCGQKLAVSASSGSSTGPHLHLTWSRGGTSTDNYAGPCSGSPGVWVGQRGYNQSPTNDCERHCECHPGQVQEEGCGRCGVRRRGCGGDCRWGGWSGCEREGPCWPGQVESRGCCDCGAQQRSCSGACQWHGWSACAGADPPGAPSCATGKLGVCAEGRTRCIGGCLACVQGVEPSPEICDEKDNDCDGPVDEGSPATLGSPPPLYAARVVDASFPRHLPPGGEATAWVVFENVGRERWKARETWLRADAPASGHASLLAPPRGWAAFDAPAVLGHDVAPGETAHFVFPVATASDGDRDVSETFSLVMPDGRAVACPEGSMQLAIASVEAAAFPAPAPARARPAAAGADGCAHVNGAAIALLGFLARRRTRRGR